MGGLMLGGKRCYLCGGKLVNGRCVECGLDNEKNTKKVYHLNESVKMQDSQPRDAVQKIGKGLAIGSVILLVAAVGTLFYAQLPQTRINTGIAQNLKTIKRIYNHT